ncbi:uncharacterized protein LOC8027075 [Ixodes scapularis]|uniref:uncharacterized protein LOC8027075 n=1 Tax=Ixodes scapularis TaxID=6945 RepID=UPI001C3854B1|nr:uncharacterized protein LOC8027075 [Ixodes scapularis]
MHYRTQLVQEAMSGAEPGPSDQGASPVPVTDEDSEGSNVEHSQSVSADVGCQANIPLGTNKKMTQTAFRCRSIGTQTQQSICHVGSQTDSTAGTQGPPLQASTVYHPDEPGDHADGDDTDDEAVTALSGDGDTEAWKDPPYCPDESDMDDSDDETDASTEQPKPERFYEKKFLVFESNLRELLDSQPVLHRKPMGNLAVCSATLFSGSSPAKVLRLFSFLGMESVKKSQYFKIQRCYMLPAVSEVWFHEQATILDELRGRKLCLAGDGRADTPGHCADFGTYTLLETSVNRILHTELVKSTEVSSSNRMETEGMERSLNFLCAQDMTVDTLVTDRHSEGKASLKRNHPGIKHRFDVWHVAKGVNKKIVAAARSKQHNVLLKWSKTIVRHLHWCASTSDGDGKLVLAKWTSLIRHIINVHRHPDPLHPACEHGNVPDRLWLEEGTETFRKLEAILMAPNLLRDIPFLSPKEQTFGLESFHAVLIHFAPKSSKFQYDGMLARTYIAALHYNQNAGRDVLLDEDGSPKFYQRCSKAQKRWTLAPVKESVTYDYVRKLCDAVLECVNRWPTYAIAGKATYRVSHDTLSSKCGPKPSMGEAVARHRSRFST